MGRPKSGTHIRKPDGSLYDTPEQEYVESPNGIGLRELAQKWKVDLSTFARWSKANGWQTKRKQYVATIEECRHEAAAKELAARAGVVAREMARMRVDVNLQHAQTARALRALIIGKMREPGRTITDLQRLASALANVATLERDSLEKSETSSAQSRPSIAGTLLGPAPAGVDTDDDSAGDSVGGGTEVKAPVELPDVSDDPGE